MRAAASQAGRIKTPCSGLSDAGYDEKHLLGIVLAIGVKTLSNDTNHLSDAPLDGVLKAREHTAYKTAQRLVEHFLPRRG